MSTGRSGPPKTPVTDPIEHKMPALVPPDSVCRLREYGGTLELGLSLSRMHWSLGSGRGHDAVDLVVPGRHVSRLHAQLERQQTWLRVTNRSANGCYMAGAPFEEMMVQAGQTFSVGSTELLALDSHLILLRARLAWHLGFDDHAAVDEALIRVADLGQPALLLTGPAGSDALTLARAMWRHSTRRVAPFVEIGCDLASGPLRRLLEAVRNGVAFVDITPLRGKRASKALVTGLFGEGRERPRLRPVIVAASVADYRSTFDRHGFIAEIQIPAVASRRAEVPQLLDGHMASLSSPHRVAELGAARIDALCAFDWPDNLEDIQRTAQRLAAYLANDRHMGRAAAALGVHVSTLREALTRIGATSRGGDR